MTGASQASNPGSIPGYRTHFTFMDNAHNYAISIVAQNQVGILRDIGSVCAEYNANIVLTQQETVTSGSDAGYSCIDLEKLRSVNRCRSLYQHLDASPESWI